jgi:hypothetical protein
VRRSRIELDLSAFQTDAMTTLAPCTFSDRGGFRSRKRQFEGLPTEPSESRPYQYTQPVLRRPVLLERQVTSLDVYGCMELDRRVALRRAEYETALALGTI